MEISKELFEQTLEAGGFQRDDAFPTDDPNQFQYRLSESMGTGIFRYYIMEHMFVIEVHEFRFKNDTFIESPEPRFLSIQYYSSVSGEELHPYYQLSPNSLRAYIGDGNRIYQALFHKDIPIRSVSISIMPEFYERYLKDKLGGEALHLNHAFQTLTGGFEHPQLVVLLKQIQSYTGYGPSAKLFYEGKVLEAVALVLDKFHRSSQNRRKLRMTEEDKANLNAAIRYIDNHYAFGVTLEQLSKICFMGTTKLKTAFREYVGCSISEYLIHKRIDHAQHLLIATDLSVSEIAKAVGYKRSDSFSSQFLRITSFHPTEYRGLISHS